jgi:cytoskeleton protein RodZ
MSELAEAVAAVSAGTLLRRAREAAGLHVAAVAVALKVPVRKLEALEEDRYEDMGDPVFIRGLASSVCRTLKVDPQPILERLPQTAAPRLARDTDGLNAPFRAPSDAAPPSWVDRARQPVPLTVIALLLGAVVIAVLPMSAWHIEEKLVPQAAAPAPARAPVVANAPQPATAASEPAPVVATTATPAALSVVAETSGAPAPAGGIVVFRAKGESWVEVVDAQGVVALRKLVTPGESVGASGALPLRVTIGKVDVTEVQVRGKPFDLKPVSRDNVARFEVK